MKNRNFCIWVALCGLVWYLAVALWGCQYVAGGESDESPGRVTFLDVGQGLAVLLEYGGRFALYDCGQDSSGIIDTLRNRGIDSLDWVLLSHNHRDHLGGALELLSAGNKAVHVSRLIVGPDTAGGFLADSVLRLAGRRGIPVDTVYRGDQVFLGAEKEGASNGTSDVNSALGLNGVSGLNGASGGVGQGLRLDCLWPPEYVLVGENRASVVMRVSLAGESQGASSVVAGSTLLATSRSLKPASGGVRQAGSDDLMPSSGGVRRAGSDDLMPALGSTLLATSRSLKLASGGVRQTGSDDLMPSSGGVRQTGSDDLMPSSGGVRQTGSDDLMPSSGGVCQAGSGDLMPSSGGVRQTGSDDLMPSSGGVRQTMFDNTPPASSIIHQGASDGPLLAKSGGASSAVVRSSRLAVSANSILLTGDLDSLGEACLMEISSDVTAGLLQVGHHGSAHSSSLKFLNRVSPRYAVVSVGAKNNYGHPTKSVLRKLMYVLGMPAGQNLPDAGSAPDAASGLPDAASGLPDAASSSLGASLAPIWRTDLDGSVPFLLEPGVGVIPQIPLSPENGNGK